MKIHPTALVDPSARLADDVEVGPWAIIGPQITLGPGCIVQARCILEGEVTVGSGNVFGYGSVIGAPPQDFAFDPATTSGVRIGNDNTFREYVTIHRGTKSGSYTVVGDRCYLMVGTHLGHNVNLGNRIVVANNTLFAGYVDVDDSTVIGGGCVFHQFIRIGRGCMVRGASRFSKDIPPFCVADTNNTVRGVNTIGLRRSGVDPTTRTIIRRAFKAIFLSDLSISEALDKAEKEEWPAEVREFFEFIRASKRGVCTTIPTFEREETRE